MTGLYFSIIHSPVKPKAFHSKTRHILPFIRQKAGVQSKPTNNFSFIFKWTFTQIPFQNFNFQITSIFREIRRKFHLIII